MIDLNSFLVAGVAASVADVDLVHGNLEAENLIAACTGSDGTNVEEEQTHDLGGDQVGTGITIRVVGGLSSNSGRQNSSDVSGGEGQRIVSIDGS